MMIAEAISDGLAKTGGGDIDEGRFAIWASALESNKITAQQIRVIT